jgi:hypothetical protein
LKKGTVSAAVFQKIVKDTVLQHHVRRAVESFRTTRSVLKSAGRPQENQNTMEYVEALVEENPQTSLRRLSAQTDVSLGL